jgi:hypothetical protein
METKRRTLNDANEFGIHFIFPQFSFQLGLAFRPSFIVDSGRIFALQRTSRCRENLSIPQLLKWRLLLLLADSDANGLPSPAIIRGAVNLLYCSRSSSLSQQTREKKESDLCRLNNNLRVCKLRVNGPVSWGPEEIHLLSNPVLVWVRHLVSTILRQVFQVAGEKLKWMLPINFHHTPIIIFNW